MGKEGLAGLVVMGSNGEAPYLMRMKRLRLWAFTRKHLPSESS